MAYLTRQIRSSGICRSLKIGLGLILYLTVGAGASAASMANSLTGVSGAYPDDK